MTRQRAYRERKVNHTVELEDRITYLEVLIEELRVENKQLEVDISRTQTENGTLRKSLLGKWQPNPVRPARTSTPAQPNTRNDVRTKPVLLRDLLMVYGREGDDGLT